MPLLVVAVAWLAQGAVLRNGWVWDDAIVVRDDPTIARGLAAVPELLSGRWGGRTDDVGLFRPLVNATLAVEAELHGLSSPFPFHLTNLFLHGAVAVLLLAALHRLLPARPVVASTAALLFAAHPLHTGTVSWIVARGDLLAACFLLLAVLAWTRPRGLDASAVLLAALAWFAALLSKEMALGLPIVLLVIDVARLGGVGAAVRRRGVAYAALLVPLAGWWWLRSGALDGFAMTSLNAPLGLPRAVRAAARGLRGPRAHRVEGARPRRPHGRRDERPRARARRPAAARLRRRRAPRLARGGRAARPSGARTGGRRGRGAPALRGALDPRPPDRAARRRVRGPLRVRAEPRGPRARGDRGRAAPLGPALRDGPRVLAPLACVVVLAAAVPACWAVAGDWRDDETFSRALLRADPGHVRALTRLGRHLVLEARRDRELAEALPVTPANRPLIGAHLASAAARTAEAVRLLERARSLPDGRRSALVSWRLGDAYMALREPRFEAAEEAYRRVLETKRVRVGPRRVPWNRVTDKTRVATADRRDLAMLFWNRALAADGIGEGERAAGFTEAAAEWYPEDARDPERYRYVRQAGVLVWRQLDDPGRALPWLVEAARIAPPSERAVASADADAARDAVRDRSKNLYDRGLVAYEQGPERYGEALSLFRETVAIRPNLRRRLRLDGADLPQPGRLPFRAGGAVGCARCPRPREGADGGGCRPEGARGRRRAGGDLRPRARGAGPEREGRPATSSAARAGRTTAAPGV